MDSPCFISLVFESSVIQDGSKTIKGSGISWKEFESSVIQDGSKTGPVCGACSGLFESSVIQDGSKTLSYEFCFLRSFESSVLQDGSKTLLWMMSRTTSFESTEPLEETLTKAMARLAVIDSRRWISFLLELLPKLDDTDFAALPAVEKRMLQMFYVTVFGKTVEDWNSDEALDNLYALADSPVLLSEMIELLKYQYNRIDFIDAPVEVGFDCPLDLHCTYTRDQIMVALDFLKPATVREGVKWLPDQKLDVFFVTLNKADKDYSPTTIYNDYSINEWLFHWQSQSTTAAESPTGQRYIHHKERGSKDLLFVREFKADRITNGAEAYTLRLGAPLRRE